MKLKPFAFIIKYFIYFNTFYDYLIYYHNALQTPTPNTGFTRRLYSVHAARQQRAHGALEDPTALPQRLSNKLWKREAAALNKKINAAVRRSRRLHSVCTALLVFAQRAPLRSAIF